VPGDRNFQPRAAFTELEHARIQEAPEARLRFVAAEMVHQTVWQFRHEVLRASSSAGG